MNMNSISIVLPVENHNFESDNRVLIPFIQYQKYGFMNKSKEVVVKPTYDFVLGAFHHEKSLVRVCVLSSHAYLGTGGKIISHPRKLFGVMDANGELIVSCEYVGIQISDDSEYITLQHPVLGYSLIDRHGNTIIPYGVYNYMDGVDHNLARVYVVDKETHEKRWGLVDTTGRVALPLEYTNIWNFHEKNRTSTTVEKGKVVTRVLFDDLMLKESSEPLSEFDGDHYQDDYGTHYGEFAGSYAQDVMGYSDDVINDAFEGDPDAYWNID